MYAKVWKNKSNGQLCITIPHDAGFIDGDHIRYDRPKVNVIIYSFVCSDIYHYGHTLLLRHASQLSDLHICGVLTNKAIESYKRKPIMDYKERHQIVLDNHNVDMVIPQRERDPTNNLKYIHSLFPKSKLLLIHGSDWEDSPFPGEEYLKSIGGKFVKHPYYERLSTTKIINEIKKRCD